MDFAPIFCLHFDKKIVLVLQPFFQNCRKLTDIERLCDMHNIPIATNVATAEMLILGLDRGDLDWRNIVNPKNKK